MPRLTPPGWLARALSFLAAAVIVLALVAAAFWWQFWRARAVPLESDWTGTVLAIAGDGVSGVRDGLASQARFSDLFGIAVRGDGTVYLTDAGDAQRIRGLSPDGLVFTVGGSDRGFVDGVGGHAKFNTPSGLAIDAAGVLFVADTGNNAIRRVTPDGRVETIAGDGVPGFRDGPGRQARFNGPVGVAVDATGRVIVADTYNDRIRAIAPDGMVTTLAGNGVRGADDSVPTETRFDTPCGVAMGAKGIYVADSGSGAIRLIDAAGVVSTLEWPPGEGLVRPIGIAAGSSGEVYVTDDRGRVVEIGAGRTVRVIAGSIPGFRDDVGRDARFRRPTGVAFVSPGRLVVADAGNSLVRLVAAASRLELRPPASPLIAPRFDVDAFARQPLLWPVAPMDGPYEVAGTIGEVRGGEGTERFHAGLDVRLEQWTPVRAVRDGVVVSPVSTGDFGSLNEWLRIGSIAYVHIRAGRGRLGELFDPDRFVPDYDEAGALVGMRVKRGARFATGDVIGTVNAFNHVHLNVGWPGEEHNPLNFRLVQFEDTLAPTIARGGVRLYDEVGQPFAKRAAGRVLVSGRVQVVVDAWDQANGNLPGRRLGLYALGYQILNRDGSPAPGFDTARETVRFDQLADPSAARLIYASGSGIPFYGRRTTRFLYVVTNTFREGKASQGFWDTTVLPPGDYILRVRAADFHGNEATANRDLAVRVVDHIGNSVGR